MASMRHSHGQTLQMVCILNSWFKSVYCELQAKVRELKNSLNQEFRQIHELCLFVLSMSQKPDLIKTTLDTLHVFLSWVPLGYIFESNLLESLLRIFPQQAFRNVSLQCLTEVSGPQLLYIKIHLQMAGASAVSLRLQGRVKLTIFVIMLALLHFCLWACCMCSYSKGSLVTGPMMHPQCCCYAPQMFRIVLVHSAS